MSDDAPLESALREVPGIQANRERSIRLPLRRKETSVGELIEGVLASNRAMLGRAFTLVESMNPEHRQFADQLLEGLLPYTGNSIRVGISGVPGAGKSTFIEALGTWLVEKGHRVAVLAIDPTSELSGGSILGDKTRMEILASSESAIVRPSPNGMVPGGVARATRESILVTEAAGFDVVLVETVGVGQAETDVAWMTDFFLLLTVTGTGDDLQGIKRGVLELADCVAINKADGDNVKKAEVAKSQLVAALRLLRSQTETTDVPVLTCSAVTKANIDAVWQTIESRVRTLRANGSIEQRRRGQAVRWMEQAIVQMLESEFRKDSDTAREHERLRGLVHDRKILPFSAARELVRGFLNRKRETP